MRRFLCFFFVAMLAALTSVVTAVSVERGVSRQLALERKATISDIVYNLSLRIDSVAAVSPSGRVEIRFDCLSAGEPLQLDFAGEKVVRVEVNGREVSSPKWEEGHIVLPGDLLRRGSNSVVIEFLSADRALNRNPEYMYSLFVPNRAHSVFPCFDQPDMKGVYNLRLTIPTGWKGVGNSPVLSEVTDETSGMTTILFAPTEPLSTYLFAFAAGKFNYSSCSAEGRTIGAYHRESDPDRLRQLDEIFAQVGNSLRELEEYTGIPYPFAKYDLVILPGFQFGGMEHTGATFYRDSALFLARNATAADLLRRAQVIAHETSHMWFGDYVTMEWFDDVWVKEVFANYFAALLTRRLLPEFDHDLEWLRVYMTPALDQDRTSGSTPIRQDLDNLRNAGLVYNNIIYNKSPLMLRKLEEQTGEDPFRRGVRKYLNDHPYGNADWEDIARAFADCSDADVEGFCNAWVNERGMPELAFALRGDSLEVTQRDPLGRGIVWPQMFDVIVGARANHQRVGINFDGTCNTLRFPVSADADEALILPAADGRAYGLLSVEEGMLERLMADFTAEDGLCSTITPTGRLATLMMLNENYKAGRIDAGTWLGFLIGAIRNTSDTQMLSALAGYVGPSLLDLPAERAADFEDQLLNLGLTHPERQGRTLILRSLTPSMRSGSCAGALLRMWREGEPDALGEEDLTNLALRLAIIFPAEADSILAVQRSRIVNPDRLRKFDYVSRAAVSDAVSLDSLFTSLSDPTNRLVEPWTLEVLSLLNHPLRHGRSVRYIRPALEMLPEIQRTGDIFFPANWAAALLGSYRSEEAAETVSRFLADHSDMNPLLLNKIRHAADPLLKNH